MKQIHNVRSAAASVALILLAGLMSLGAFTRDADAGYGLKQLFSFFSDAKSVYEAPKFELPDIEGGVVSLVDYRGQRPVLLYFWATWCPACRAAKPDLIKLRERTKDEDLAIFAIDVGSGDSFEKLKRYQQSHPLPFPVLYDNEGRVSQDYAVQGIPLFVLIDKGGNVVYREHELPDDYNKYLAAKE
jgi:peroxiredoxin